MDDFSSKVHSPLVSGLAYEMKCRSLQLFESASECISVSLTKKGEPNVQLLMALHYGIAA